MIPRELYDFLEESGKKDYVDIIKGELKEGVENAGKFRDAKRELEEANKFIEGIKPFSELIQKENLTTEAISDMLNKSREGESELDVFRRELESYKNQVSTLTKTLEERDSKLTEAQVKERENELKGIFSKVLDPINSLTRDIFIENSISKKSIMFDSENKPVGEIDGVYYEPKQFAEKFMSANPDLVTKKGGANSNPGNKDGKQTADLLDKTPLELFSMSHNQK